MAEEIGSLAVSLSLDSADFSRSMASVDRALKTLGQEMRINQNHGKEWGNSLTGLSTKQESLTRMLSAQDVKVRQLNEAYQKSKEETGETSKQTENLATRLNKATAEYTRTETELAQVTAALKKQQDELKLSQSGWTQLGEKMTAVGSSMKKVGDGMKSVGKDLSMKVTAPLVAFGGLATKASIDFESAFAGVRKTVDMTEAEFGTLSDSIRQMSKEIPAAATEIAGVAEAAGQLGIQNDAILGFTRTMVDMGVATDMASDDAAMALARLATITQMNQQDFDKLGSTVVGLGNNLAATESEIVEMGLRLAGAGSVIGMTEAQVLGFSGALAAVGVNAEAGGSAFSKLFIEAANLAATGGEGLTQFAEVAGMTSKEFQKAFKEDATGAIIDFIEGLGKINEAGGNVFGVLDDLGLSEIRLRDALLRTSGASDTLREAVNLGTKSWEENNALTNEAAERYETTASQLQIFKNKLTDLGITIGDILVPVLLSVVEAVEPWIEKFATLSKETQKTMLVIGGIAAAIGPVLVIIGTLVSSVGAIVGAMGTVSASIGVLTTGVASSVPALTALSGAFTMLTGPIGLVIAAISAVVAAAVTLYVKWDEIEEKFGTVGQAIGTFAVGPLGVVVAGIKTFQDAVSDAIEPIERFGESVSEATQEAVGGFMDMTEQANAALKELVWGQQEVTQELAKSMADAQAEITNTLLEAIASRHTAEIEATKEQFANINALSEEQKAAILERTNQHFEAEAVSVETGTAKINEIWQKAADEGRSITEDESQDILFIREQMTNQAVQVMSQNAEEQRLIYERMKDNASDLSAIEAAEVVQNATQKKDDVINEAEEQYTQTRLWAEQQRDELGNLSAEEAQAVIDEAAKKRDESVSMAEDMHAKVIDQAQQQADEHINLVDWETGEILTKWEVFKNNATQKFEEIKQILFDKFVEMVANTVAKGSEIVTAAQDKFEETKVAIKTKLEEAVVEVALQIGKMPGKVREQVSAMKTAGAELINGVISGITSKFTEGLNAIGNFAKSLVARFKKDTDTHSPSRAFEGVSVWFAPGVAQGIKKTSHIAINEMSDMTKKLIAEARNILVEGTKNINKEVAEIEKKATDESRKITTRANQDINLIHSKAKKAKRKLTAAENIRIQRIEEDSAAKVKKINEKSAADVLKVQNDARKKSLDALKIFIEDKKFMEELSLVDEAKIWEESIKLFADGSKEKVAAQKEYQKAVEAVNKEIVATNKEFEGEMQKINDDLVKQVDDLNEAYEDSLNKRTQSLQTFKGIFDSFEWHSGPSSYELLNNLESQVEGFELWQKEIDKLASKAIDEGLISELREMGPKALPELLALNDMTEEQLTEYSDLYGKKMQLAREQAEAELVGMKIDTEEQITELRKVANDKLGELQRDWTTRIKAVTQATTDEFKSLTGIGKQAGQNLLDGLSSMEDALISKARSIAMAVNSALQGALGGSSYIPMAASISGFNGGYASGVMNDNSRSVVNNVMIQSSDANAVNDTERMLRRLAFQFN